MMTSGEHVWFGKNPVVLRFMTQEQFATLDSPTVTSVHLFPMDGEDILLTRNPRGLDIIGGHVEKGESVEDALRREAMEEGYIELRSAHLIGYIQVDNSVNPNAANLPYPLYGYQAFYVTDDYIPHDFHAEHECSERVFIATKDISIQHHNWTQTHAMVLEHYLRHRQHPSFNL